jgi:GTP cyclohydrolase IA
MRGDVHPLTHHEVDTRAYEVARIIHHNFPPQHGHLRRVYAIPRGGVPAAYAIMRHLPSSFTLVQSPEQAEIIIDDLVDSGRTRDKVLELAPLAAFFSLFNKQTEPLGWVVFPWEGDEQGSIQDSTVRLLQYIGEDPDRDGLIKTPDRVARAWKDWTSGYGQNPATILTTFKETGNYDEMVLVRDLPFYSQCEHHLAPFFGHASVAYIPDGQIVGLSKLDRVVNIFARRLQVQERMTTQIVDALMEHLKPKGAAVRLSARHLCMESRGIHKQGHQTVTQALRGVFYDDPRTRSEFLGALG